MTLGIEFLLTKTKVHAYTHAPGDEDRVSVFIQDNAVVTSGYGDVEAQDHKGEGRQQRLEVYTHPNTDVDQQDHRLSRMLYISSQFAKLLATRTD